MVVVCTLSWRGVRVGLKEGQEKKERRYRVTSEEITERSCTSFKDFFKGGTVIYSTILNSVLDMEIKGRYY